jgi:hypothetical protein
MTALVMIGPIAQSHSADSILFLGWEFSIVLDDQLLVPTEKPQIPWNSIRWWDYGTRDEILNAPNRRLDGRSVAVGSGPHPTIVIDLKIVTPIHFECQD